MYSKGPTITLKNSASYIPGNLAVFAGLERESSATYAVAHRSTVLVAHSTSGMCTHTQTSYDDMNDRDPACFLTQAKWCRLRSSRVVLVLTSYRGFKFLDWNGSRTILEHRIKASEGEFDQRFGRGIASIGNSICVGSYEGDISVYSMAPQDRAEGEGEGGGGPELQRHLQGHSAPLCDIATNQQGEMASCDESGMVIVWIDPLTSADSSLVFNDSGGVPCLCLCYWNNLVIAGFSDGIIRIYDTDRKSKLVEIAAHGRLIIAMDVAADTGLLLSVAEDSTANVWRLPTEVDPKVSLVFSVVVPDSVLCGGRFCDPRGDKFVLTAYDSKDIISFTKS